MCITSGYNNTYTQYRIAENFQGKIFFAHFKVLRVFASFRHNLGVWHPLAVQIFCQFAKVSPSKIFYYVTLETGLVVYLSCRSTLACCIAWSDKLRPAQLLLSNPIDMNRDGSPGSLLGGSGHETK